METRKTQTEDGRLAENTGNVTTSNLKTKYWWGGNHIFLVSFYQYVNLFYQL